MEKLCCIISAGDVNLPLLKEKKSEYDYFIAADLGFAKAKEAGITPNQVVGDFDSLGHIPCESSLVPEKNELSSKFKPFPQENKPSTKVKCYPPEKDKSDTHLAIEEGISLGYMHFHVYGALGGDRFSHSIANLQTICGMKSKGIHITLIGEKEIVYVIQNETLKFSSKINSTFSVFSLSEKTSGVSITGAKYPLDNATLTYDFPLGVSNLSTKETVTVSSKEGILFVLLEL